jgi:acyltransferase
MLFSVELVHYCIFRFIKSSNAAIIIAAFVFYVVGYWFNLKMDLFNPAKGRIVGWNYLFIHEAITMYGFYLFGLWLHRKRFLIGAISPALPAAGAVIGGLIVSFTCMLNTGPFNFHYYNAVVIMFASHGSFIWFPVTALAGSLMILFLAKLTEAWRPFSWMGSNTLILMCLNGVFYHYLNPKTAAWFLAHYSGSFPAVLGAGVVMTLVSLALCVPFVYLFNTYVPQLTGKPKTVGPWMPNLI